MDKGLTWLWFVLLAGLSWGVYVPAISFGIRALDRNAFGAFLCVGVAYFLVAIVVPIAFFTSQNSWPSWTATGVTFATFAGVAGALGGLCVIFARRFGGNPLYIGSLIFGLAPVINALVSLVWHPEPDKPFHFQLPAAGPDWKLWAGVVLVGIGAFLVLYSNAESEAKPKAAGQPTAQATVPTPARAAE
jgi:hypothetical protein